MSIKCEAVVKSTNLKTISEIPSAEVKLVISLRRFPLISEELARMIGETVNITIASQQASMLDEEEDEKPKAETEGQSQQLSIDDCGVVHTPGDEEGLELDNVIPFPESEEAEGAAKALGEEEADAAGTFDLPEGFEDVDSGFNDLENLGEHEENMLPGNDDENMECSREE
jgi:hypothetical protein